MHSSFRVIPVGILLLAPAILAGCMHVSGPKGASDASTNISPGTDDPADLDLPDLNLTPLNLTRGEIDKLVANRSLVDRLRARLGAPGAPEDLLALHGRDDGIWQEVGARWPSLSEDERAALEPFVARPSDPASVFHSSVVSVQQSAQSSSCKWVPEPSIKVHVTVWREDCREDLRPGVANVLAALEAVWEPETTFMNVPNLADAGGTAQGGSTRIDAYVVTCTSCRLEGRVSDNWTTIAAAVTDLGAWAGSGHTSFLLVEDRVALRGSAPFPNCHHVTASLRTIMAHEFFHVIQKSLHASAPGWLAEGTARWADIHFGGSAATVHSCEYPRHQDGRLGLLDRSYTAYIWWHHVATRGHPQAIAETWHALSAVSPTAPPLDFAAVADRVFSFQGGEYAEFSFRNLNRPDVDDVRPAGFEWWEDLDPAFDSETTPAGHAPRLRFAREHLVGQPATRIGVGSEKANWWGPGLRDAPQDIAVANGKVGPLNVTYLELVNSDGGPGPAGQLRLDPAALNLDSALTMEVLWRNSDGKWRRDPVTDKAVLCSPTEVYLVLTNAGLTAKPVGDLRVRALAAPCEIPDLSWVETWEWRGGKHVPADMEVHTRAILRADWADEWKAMEAQRAAVGKGYGEHTDDGRGCCYFGSGPPMDPSALWPGFEIGTYGQWVGAYASGSYINSEAFHSELVYGGASIFIAPERGELTSRAFTVAAFSEKMSDGRTQHDYITSDETTRGGGGGEAPFPFPYRSPSNDGAVDPSDIHASYAVVRELSVRAGEGGEGSWLKYLLYELAPVGKLADF